MKLSELNKRKIRYKNGAIKVPFTCLITFTNPKTRQEESGRGRTFEVEKDIRIDLFPIGVLCRMLGRGYRAIYKWEKDFGFPPAMWRVADDKTCNRWYSRKQLVAIRAIYDHYGQLRGKKRNKLRDFIAAVRGVFHTVDMPAELRESTNGQTEEKGHEEENQREAGAPQAGKEI